MAYNGCQGEPPGLEPRWPGELDALRLPRRKTGKRREVLSNRPQSFMVLLDQVPSPPPAHVFAENLRIRGSATAEQRRSTPTRFQG